MSHQCNPTLYDPNLWHMAWEPWVVCPWCSAVTIQMRFNFRFMVSTATASAVSDHVPAAAMSWALLTRQALCCCVRRFINRRLIAA